MFLFYALLIIFRKNLDKQYNLAIVSPFAHGYPIVVQVSPDYTGVASFCSVRVAWTGLVRSRITASRLHLTFTFAFNTYLFVREHVKNLSTSSSIRLTGNKLCLVDWNI